MALTVRPLREADLDGADQIMRVAFGTFIGIDPPEAFAGDAAFVGPRFRARPDAAFALEVDGVLAGSNFATQWGRFGFFGPLSIDPAHWGRGYARALMEPIVATLDGWGVSHAGLFTFPHSAKHIGLYQGHGFRAQALTLVLGRALAAPATPTPAHRRDSALSADERAETRAGLRALCDAVLPGFAPDAEVESIGTQGLGETVSIWRDERAVAFACVHAGAGSEAGSATGALKLAVVEAGVSAAADLAALLAVCEAVARERGATRLQAGVNAANAALYEALLGLGFQIDLTGIAMQRPNRPGLCAPEHWVVGDWR